MLSLASCHNKVSKNVTESKDSYISVKSTPSGAYVFIGLKNSNTNKLIHGTGRYIGLTPCEKIKLQGSDLESGLINYKIIYPVDTKKSILDSTIGQLYVDTLVPGKIYKINESSQHWADTLQHRVDTSRRIVTVRTYIHHISDLDFREEQYQVEIWLYLTSARELPDSLKDEFQVENAKTVESSFIPIWHERQKIKGIFYKFSDSNTAFRDSCFRRILKIKCTMAKKWDVNGFPFDAQELNIKIYTLRPRPYLSLIPLITPHDSINISENDLENGWHIKNDAVSVKPDSVQAIFNSSTKFSAISYGIPISRNSMPSLFLKLFIGLYVAFAVSFIALFIPVTNVEPRFGLPVGGLFAAIANKYVIEDMLPPTSEFTLVDMLHSTTIVFILLIIVYSAMLLYLTEKSKPVEVSGEMVKRKTRSWYRFKNPNADLKSFDNRMIALLIASYFVANLIFIAWGKVENT